MWVAREMEILKNLASLTKPTCPPTAHIDENSLLSEVKSWDDARTAVVVDADETILDVESLLSLRA
jgi:hypothetical protein